MDDIGHSRELQSARTALGVYFPGDSIYRQGDASDTVYNLISGWVGLQHDLADGRRQITRFVLPGDMFGVEPAGADHAQAATVIATASVCAISRASLDRLRREVFDLNERYIWMLERDHHLAVDALTMMAQGSAMERIARLLWELASRIAGRHAVRAGFTAKMPLMQRHVGEATGLTAIHVNRVLRRLREDAVAEFHEGLLMIGNPARLRQLADPSEGADVLWRGPVGDVRWRPATGRGATTSQAWP
jgi:CRP-like cAMP-binding protein